MYGPAPPLLLSAQCTWQIMHPPRCAICTMRVADYLDRPESDLEIYEPVPKSHEVPLRSAADDVILRHLFS